jgi:hypothetical protein
MLEIIQPVLTELLASIDPSLPKTKQVEKSLSVFDVDPIDIPAFMHEHGIPDNASFAGNPNGYDGYDDFLICWNVEVPTTAEDRLQRQKTSFNFKAERLVYAAVTQAGYVRRPFDSKNWKPFKDTTPYDLFVAGELDRLVAYYNVFYKESVT